MKAQIAVLPGDGIGPEIIEEATLLLEEVAKTFNHSFEFRYGLIGGIAVDRVGIPLPEETIRICQESAGVLLGAVGGPKWDFEVPERKPETGLLRIRKELGLYANLRPITFFPNLVNSSPLKPEVIENTDILIVRELTGGLYFGKPRGRRETANGLEVIDTLVYSEEEIERIIRRGFELARGRRKKLTSVDKANVLESSRLWREIAERVAKDFPDVELNHLLVDNAAMQLIVNPRQFDVIVTENMFGDILSDEASVITGSLGMLPSASIGGSGPGLYEPIHGSAPDIAGKNIANPLATLQSVALLLRHSLRLEKEAKAVEQAVEQALALGYRTRDIAGKNTEYLTTEEMGRVVRDLLKEPKTLFAKIWEQHEVVQDEGKPSLLYIDQHLVHEVTSPQAFAGLRLAGRSVRRPELTFATMDHNVPTVNPLQITDQIAAQQMSTLAANCEEYGIKLADLHSEEQGIIHVIGPELGLTLPGKTIVCGDSHTSTHGAFGALAFGIGTSEVEHVLATQCLWQAKPKTLKVNFTGKRPHYLSAKDIILALIAEYGTDFGSGYVLEFTGSVIKEMSMEERMTICNMAIEAGAKAGLIAPDETTFNYLKGRKYAPQGEDWVQAVARWSLLKTDEGAEFDREIDFAVADLQPQVTWGTNPGMGAGINDTVPDPKQAKNKTESSAISQAINYMGLQPGMKITDIQLDYVFIGSCTNSRIEDLRAAAKVAKGQKVAAQITALVVPGSKLVKQQAEAEGLDQVFIEAGFEWRETGCSMCLSMNPDVVPAGKRCASTSNRNFEGRQGRGARTHLVSPAMAAAAAIHGHFINVSELLSSKGEVE